MVCATCATRNGHATCASRLLAVLVAARTGRIQDAERIDRFVLGTCRNTSMRMRAVDARATLVGDDKELDVVPFLEGTEFVETGALVRCMAALDHARGWS